MPHAAARAEETDRDDAYVRDPLAAVLAGKKAVKDRKVRDLLLTVIK